MVQFYNFISHISTQLMNNAYAGKDMAKCEASFADHMALVNPGETSIENLSMAFAQVMAPRDPGEGCSKWENRSASFSQDMASRDPGEGCSKWENRSASFSQDMASRDPGEGCSKWENRSASFSQGMAASRDPGEGCSRMENRSALGIGMFNNQRLFSDMDGRSGSIDQHRLMDLAYDLHMFSGGGMNNENEPLVNSFDGEPRGKKSQNTTECVPVPSSEHVAEIVGRQGCKIKALRAKTNTYIKTPVRGEEPVFVVTGRKEDVNSAKREILSAAEHFSQIRAQRKNNLNGSVIPGPNSNIPGQTTIQVRVPYRVVGLVVGPKGATIKRIQQQTNTYIVTPSRDKEPIFEVTGLPDNVESARKEIEAHIAMRTGGTVDGMDDEFNGNMESLTNNLNAINSSLFKNDMTSSFICPFTRDSNNLLDLQTGDSAFNFPLTSRSTKQNDIFNNFFNFSSGFGFYDSDEGLGDSPTYEAPNASASGSSWPDFGTSTLTDSAASLFGSTSISDSSNGLSDISQRSNSISGALTDLIIGDHPPARRIRSDPLTVPEVGDILGNLGSLSLGNTISSFSPLGSSITSSTAPASLTSVFPAAANKCTSSSSSSPVESLAPGKKINKRDCVVCFESTVVAALVPCGHNLFCLECANRICENQDAAECPVCRQRPTQAIRIYN